jgi:hypothetical protein
MKRLLKKLALTFMLTLTGICLLNGQNEIILPKIYSRNDVALKGETDIKEIKLPLRDSLNTVNILIFAIIGSGELTVEIYDPAGERRGNFSLACQINPEMVKKIQSERVTLKEIDESAGKAMGNLFKTIKNPIRGFWIAKIRSIGAIGSVTIQLGDQIIEEGSPFIYKIN